MWRRLTKCAQHHTIVSDADIAYCATCWMGQQRQQAEAFKDIMQRIIFPTRFEDAMQSECEVICMWYEGTKRTPTYVIVDGENIPEPD